MEQYKAYSQLELKSELVDLMEEQEFLKDEISDIDIKKEYDDNQEKIDFINSMITDSVSSEPVEEIEEIEQIEKIEEPLEDNVEFPPMPDNLFYADGGMTKKYFVPRYVQDKISPNFLNVYIDYPTPSGVQVAYGKETMSGQQRRLGSEKAMNIAKDIVEDIKNKYGDNLEDIDYSDNERGKVTIFAVSDDFADVKFALGGYLASAGIGAYYGAKNPKSVKKVTDPIDKAISQIGKNLTDKKYAKGGVIEERVYALDMRADMYQDEGFFTYNQFKRYADELSDDDFMDEAENQGLVWSSMDNYMWSNEYNENGDNLVERKISVEMRKADEYVNPDFLAKGGEIKVGDYVSVNAGYGMKHIGKVNSKHHMHNDRVYVDGIGDALEIKRLTKVKPPSMADGGEIDLTKEYYTVVAKNENYEDLGYNSNTTMGSQSKAIEQAKEWFSKGLEPIPNTNKRRKVGIVEVFRIRLYGNRFQDKNMIYRFPKRLTDLIYRVNETYPLGERVVEKPIEENYAKGGALSKEFKFDKNFVIYVPSTTNVGNKISKKELDKRVGEVEKYVANEFGGYTETDTDGGYKSTSGEIIEEDIVKVSVFANNKDWKENESKVVSKVKEWATKWGQEAIGFEYEGDLYYIDEEGKFAKGGKLRNTEYNLRTFFTFDGEDFAIFGGHLYGAREGDNEFMLIDNINYAPKEVQVAYYEKMRGFAKGGTTKDYSYDYEDIGQFSMNRESWGNYTNKQFEKIGKDIVENDYDGNIKKAYDSIVRKTLYPKKFAKGGEVITDSFGDKYELREDEEININDYVYFGDTGDISVVEDEEDLEFARAGKTKAVPYAKGGETASPITNYHKNFMGTLSFDLKVKGMRKSQDFIVYPITGKTNIIRIQSDKKWGEIDATTGKGILSKTGNNSWAFALDVSNRNVNKFELSDEELEELKNKIRETSGKEVGNAIITTDNSGAELLADGGELNMDEVSIYQDADDNYTIVMNGDVYDMNSFSMPNTSINNYIGDRRDYPSDISHWGKKITYDNAPMVIKEKIDMRKEEFEHGGKIHNDKEDDIQLLKDMISEEKDEDIKRELKKELEKL